MGTRSWICLRTSWLPSHFHGSSDWLSSGAVQDTGSWALDWQVGLGQEGLPRQPVMRMWVIKNYGSVDGLLLSFRHAMPPSSPPHPHLLFLPLPPLLTPSLSPSFTPFPPFLPFSWHPGKCMISDWSFCGSSVSIQLPKDYGVPTSTILSKLVYLP